MEINGLHHITAVTATVQNNVNFYTRLLGMRMVAKSINQDDTSAYHLFYGDKIGSPGTDLTFFDWPQVVKNVNGAGSIARVALRVPSQDALQWWAERLTDSQIEHSGMVEFHGHVLINFADPEGLQLALVDDKGTPGGMPWEKSPIPPDYSIRGLFATTLLIRNAEPIKKVLTEVMGYRQAAEYPNSAEPNERTIVFETGQGGPGNELYLIEQPANPDGRVGAGGVHHIAFRVANDHEHKQWRERLVSFGLDVSPIIDRHFSRAIYFRVPGGFLFEIATDEPGFAYYEDVEHMGERLLLPPFLEPERAKIEARLTPIAYP